MRDGQCRWFSTISFGAGRGKRKYETGWIVRALSSAPFWNWPILRFFRCAREKEPVIAEGIGGGAGNDSRHLRVVASAFTSLQVNGRSVSNTGEAGRVFLPAHESRIDNAKSGWRSGTVESLATQGKYPSPNASLLRH
jgi:hypothetical protein